MRRAHISLFSFCVVPLALGASLAQTATVSLTSSAANTTSGAPVTFACSGAVNSVAASGGTYALTLDGTQIYSASTAGSGITYTAGLPPGSHTVQCTGPTGTQYGSGSASVTETVAANPNLSWIIATSIADASGSPLQRGAICFTPVDANYSPAPFQISGGGNALPKTVCRPVQNGALQAPLTLARSDKTMPVGINYRIVVQDAITGTNSTLGTASVTGDTWNLGYWSSADVQTAPLAAWVQGPPGPPGPPGSGGGSAAAAGSAGQVQIAGPNNTFAAATPLQLLAALPYTPANVANNLSDLPSAAQARSNLGAATATDVTALQTTVGQHTTAIQAAQSTANAALPKAGGTLTGTVTHADGTPLASQNYVGSQVGPVSTAATNAANAATAAQATANAALPKSGGTLTGTLTNVDGSPVASQAYVAANGSAPTRANITNALGAAPVLATARAAYAAGTTYAQGSVVTDGNGNGWTSLVNSNTGNTPSTSGDTANWRLDLRAPGAASSPSGSASGQLLLSGGAGNAVSAAPDVIKRGDGKFQTPAAVAKGPKINVLHSDFAGGADPTGAADSTAAIAAAVNYAKSLVTNNNPAPILYIPGGTYKFSGTAAFPISAVAGLSIEGDGSGHTILNCAATSGDCLELKNAGGNQPYTQVHYSGFSIFGLGHSSSANLIEVLSGQYLTFNDISLQNTGGICLNMQGDPERSTYINVNLDNCRRSSNLGQNSNEIAFYNLNVQEPGNERGGGWSWNVNANPTTGQIPAATAGQVWLPDYHAAVTVFNSQNTQFDRASIKGTPNAGAYQFYLDNGFRVQGTYCEGFALGTTNPCLQVGGATPMGHTTTALAASSSALSVGVDDALYNPMYIGDGSSGSMVPGYSGILFPPDYVPGSSTLSSICSGVSGCSITQGTVEGVGVGPFTGAGLVNGIATPAGTEALNGRGAPLYNNGPATTIQAWPAGAVLVGPIGAGGSTDGVSIANHWNGMLGPKSGYAQSSATALTANWTYTPAQLTSEIIVGPIYDGYDQLTPGTPSNVNMTGSLTMIADDTYFDTSGTNNGEGVATVSIQGTVNQISMCPMPQSSNIGTPGAAAAISPTRYFNLGCNAQAVVYPNASYANWSYNNSDTDTKLNSLNHVASTKATDYAGNTAGNNVEQFFGNRVTKSLANQFQLIQNDGGLFGRYSANGVDSFQANASGFTTPLAFNPSGGISAPVFDYQNGGNIPFATQYVHAFGNNTYALPNPNPGNKLEIFTFQGTPITVNASSVLNALTIASAGSGQNNGTYTLTASAGCAVQPTINYTVSGGTITSTAVVTRGQFCTAAPTFTPGANGGTAGAITATIGSVGVYLNDGQVSARNAGTPGSFTWAGNLGTISCVADSSTAPGQWICNGANQANAITVAAGTGFGTTSAAPTITGSAQAFTVSVTTTTTGTAGQNALNFTFAPAIAHPPLACFFEPQSAAAGAVNAARHSTVPTGTGVSLVMDAAAPAGIYTFSGECKRAL